MALSRRPGRSRPIRLFLITMFAVPLVSLVALYAYAASTTIANAVVDQKYNSGRQGRDQRVRRADRRPAPGAGRHLRVAEHRPEDSERVHAGRAQDRGRGVRDRPERDEAGAGRRDPARQGGPGRPVRRRGAARQDPGGRGRGHDQPAGRVPGLQQPGRRPVAVLLLLEQQGRLVHRRLDRRHQPVLRDPDGRQGGHARRRRAGQRRPDERGRPPGVHRHRGHQARPDERGHRRADARPRRPVHRPGELAAVPAVPGHGRPDHGQPGGPAAAGQPGRLAAGLGRLPGRHGEGRARQRRQAGLDEQLARQPAGPRGRPGRRCRLAGRGRLDLPVVLVRPQGHQGADRPERQRPRTWPTSGCRGWSSGSAGARRWTCAPSRRHRRPARSPRSPGSREAFATVQRRRSRPRSTRPSCARGSTRSS